MLIKASYSSQLKIFSSMFDELTEKNERFEESPGKFRDAWFTLHKKLSFPLSISSVNVTADSCGWKKLRIWSHLLRKSLMENFIFCAVSVLIRGLNNVNNEA